MRAPARRALRARGWIPLLLCLWGSCLVAPLEGAAQALLPRAAFLTQAPVHHAALSPDGLTLAYLRRHPGGDALHLLDTRTLKARPLLLSHAAEGLHWSADGEGIFLEVGAHLAYVEVETGHATYVLKRDPKRGQRILSVDGSRPHHMRMVEGPVEGGYRLLTIDREGGVQVLWTQQTPIGETLLGPDGALAFHHTADGGGQAITEEPGGIPWLRCTRRDPCQLVGLHETGALYVRARMGGDLWGLYRLEGPGAEPILLHQDPEGAVDLAAVALDPRSGAPLMARYEGARPRLYGLTPEIDAQLGALQAALGDVDLDVDLRIGAPWLVTITHPTQQHPRFALFDGGTGQLTPILEAERLAARPLPPEALAEKMPFSYRASDGVEIHAYVSAPPGVDRASAPIVVKVHGGPWSQVTHTFDPITQFLVSRGYVVLEPNFRASTGYGRAFLEAGRGAFGEGRVQQDLLDGVDAIASQGLGDGANVAMLGHSFGGFATLGAVAYNAARIKAGVASAPPIDLLRSLEGVGEEATIGNGLPLKDVLIPLLLLEDTPEARADLRRRSPEAHVAETARPLLILAGAQDDKVNIVHVRHHALAIEALGQDVSLFVDPNAGHHFSDPLLREAWLALTERFLGQHLGGAADSTLSPELRAYIDASLDLKGPSLQGE